MSRIGRMVGGWLGRRPEEVKKSAVGGLGRPHVNTAWMGLGAARWTTRSYESLAQEGYRKNVIANRCVRMIAEGAASVPWTLFRGDKRLTRHPLLDLLKRPNPMQGGAELFETFYAFLNIAGNSFLEVAETIDGMPGELYVLRPDRMKVLPGPNGWPIGYEYSVSGQSHVYAVDMMRGKSPVLHLKTFNPLDDLYGLSPLEAAAFGIDIHNAAGAWNKALFDNAARPSGALVFEPQDGSNGTLSQEQFDRLKDEMERTYQGSANAGRPLLLEGGLRWQQIAFSPQDMEFIQGKYVSAREIALAFGVPPMLLSIPGDNTYSNYQEANRAVWRQTILPLLDKTCGALNNWLIPQFGPDLRLDYDRDAVPAITADRDAAWARVNVAGFMTLNEKRAAVGLEPIDDGDAMPGVSSPPLGTSLFSGAGATALQEQPAGSVGAAPDVQLSHKFNPHHDPDDGQFTFGSGGGGYPQHAQADTGTINDGSPSIASTGKPPKEKPSKKPAKDPTVGPNDLPHGEAHKLVMENNKSGVADSVILAVAYKESRFDPTANPNIKGNTAIGLMQVTAPALEDFNMAREKEGKKPYTQEDLKDSAKNVEVGSWYLRNRIETAKRLARRDHQKIGDGVREGLSLYKTKDPHYANDILAAAKEYDAGKTDKEKMAALRRLHKPPKLKVPKE